MYNLYFVQLLVLSSATKSKSKISKFVIRFRPISSRKPDRIKNQTDPGLPGPDIQSAPKADIFVFLTVWDPISIGLLNKGLNGLHNKKAKSTDKNY
jgi:hypothetical protein